MRRQSENWWELLLSSPDYQYSKNPSFASLLPLHSGFRPSFLTSRVFFISLLPCRLVVIPRQKNGPSISKVES